MPRRRRSTQEELRALGRRLRDLRLAAGLTQAELAGDKFSHAYVSVLEAGRREPSRAALEYFAARLGVPVEKLSESRGAAWALQLAQDLRDEGKSSDGRKLLERTLENLASADEVHPRVVVALHRELGKLALSNDRMSAAEHFRKAVELADDDESLTFERADALAALAELQITEGASDHALENFRASAHLLLEKARQAYG
jgi:transcriptional regulator with XRE-family HTH domain